jgi:hypothetical protein
MEDNTVSLDMSAEASYKFVAHQRNRSIGGLSMPHVVSGTIAHTRMAGADYTKDEAIAYFWPLSRNGPLTPELLALTPNPYFVHPPKVGEMPDIFGEQVGVWTVKESVKKIIEDLEPGVHTFIPVNLRVRSKTKDFGQYFLLYVGQAIDAVVIDETDFRDGHGREGFEKASILNSLVGDTVLDASKIAGRHLWRGGIGRIGLGNSDPFYSYYFCSDELKKRIKAADIEGWRFRACKVRNHAEG